MKGYPLFPWSSPAGVLVNGRGIQDLSGSNAFADPFEVLYVLPRGTLVLLDELHECWCLIISKNDARLLL